MECDTRSRPMKNCKINDNLVSVSFFFFSCELINEGTMILGLDV